jgi:hypothetical protein
MGLQEEITNRRAEIKTDEYSMSIGELVSLYEREEIDVHPEFQRYFRWDELQKTRLIESILLGIPIPPIFVAQQENGIWDVVDGLQRLSTIYQFVGVLKDEDGAFLPPLVLSATTDLPSLSGKRWAGDDEGEDDTNAFTSAQQLMIKRARLNVSIILYDSDPRSKSLCAIMDETTSPSKFRIELQGGEQGQKACQSHRNTIRKCNRSRNVGASVPSTNDVSWQRPSGVSMAS